MEIFPENVSKAHAADWLAAYLGFTREKALGIGNDYNDEKLLEWSRLSFVVANAPEELKKKFATVSSNEENGFSEAIDRAIPI